MIPETDSLIRRSALSLDHRLRECNEDLLGCVDSAQKEKARRLLCLRVAFWGSIIGSLIITSVAFGVLFNHMYLPYGVVFRENNATLTRLEKQLAVLQEEYALLDAQWQSITNTIIYPWTVVWDGAQVKSQYGELWCSDDICHMSTSPCDITYCYAPFDPTHFCLALAHKWCVKWKALHVDEILSSYQAALSRLKECKYQITIVASAIKDGFPGERFQAKWLWVFLGIVGGVLVIVAILLIVLRGEMSEVVDSQPKILEYHAGDRSISQLTSILTRMRYTPTGREDVQDVCSKMADWQSEIEQRWKCRVAFLGGYLRPESTLYGFLNSPGSGDVKKIILTLAGLGPNK